MINTDMLTSRMQQLGLSLEELSTRAKMSEKEFCELLNNKRDMILSEAYLLCENLKIPLSEVSRYFFFHDAGSSI